MVRIYGLDLKSQSLVIESFSVGSGAVLSTMGEGFGRSRFKVLCAPVSRVTKETTCVEESIAGSGTRAEPLEALRQASQLCCFGLQMQFVTVF